MFSRLYRLLLVIGLLASACDPYPSTPTPTPTALPTLNVSLWVDFPVVPANHSQAANVVVHDASGQPVAGAVVIGVYYTLDGKKEFVYFPNTDANGLTRTPLDLPSVSTSQTITLTVVADEGGEWGQSVTSFEILP